MEDSFCSSSCSDAERGFRFGVGADGSARERSRRGGPQERSARRSSLCSFFDIL